MAVIFPAAPPTTLPGPVLKTFQALKRLPDGWMVWHHLAPWEPKTPDFLLLTPDRQALLLKVCQAAAEQVQPAAQLLLLGSTRLPLGQAEEAVLVAFLDKHGIDREKCSSALLFPNIPNRSLGRARPASSPSSLLWLGQEMLQMDVQAWQAAFHRVALCPPELEHLRAAFSPEAVVPADFSARAADPRRLEAGLTDFILDYNQEAALKTDLDLPQVGQGLARDFRTSVINGVAGSGKTLILLYRLRLLHGLYPSKRFLVLTHNRPLIRDLQDRYRRLTDSQPKNIEWATFFGWCRRHWPQEQPWVRPLSIKAREKLLEQVWEGYFKDSPVTLNMLASEVDWIKDQVEFSRQIYLSAERRGRGFRLTQEQRTRMADAIGRYQELLKERAVLDWGDVPRRIWSFIQSGRLQPPTYDVVLVDEAQFFSPLWFEVIRRMVRPESGHLFAAADPSQGFLRRGGSWKTLGLDVRGRTHRLERSYRTTREILSFAALFYRQRIPQEDAEEETLAPDLVNLPGGAFPELIPLRAAQEEIARATNEIAVLVERGMPPDHLLALHTDWQGVKALIQAICKRLGAGAAADPKERQPGGYVRVTTLNAGTGLEAPVVFLLGLNRLFEAERSLRISDEEREALILDNTRKLYMATTRAGQRLVITYVGALPEDFLRLLGTLKASSG